MRPLPFIVRGALVLWLGSLIALLVRVVAFEYAPPPAQLTLLSQAPLCAVLAFAAWSKHRETRRVLRAFDLVLLALPILLYLVATPFVWPHVPMFESAGRYAGCG